MAKHHLSRKEEGKGEEEEEEERQPTFRLPTAREPLTRNDRDPPGRRALRIQVLAVRSASLRARSSILSLSLAGALTIALLRYLPFFPNGAPCFFQTSGLCLKL